MYPVYASSNLTSLFDPKGQTVNYTYDDINRQLTEDYTGQVGTEVSYTYDSGTGGIGRLTGITTGTLSQTNTYNSLGLIKAESKVINSVTYPINYDYDRQGNQTLITNPDNSQVKYNYNSAGLLDSVQRKESTDGSYINVVTNFDYSPLEQITSQTSANGATTTNIYDAAKLYRLSSKITTIAGGSHAQDLSYTYDANGNITRIVDASATNSAKTVDYTYDSLNRLLTATATGAVNGQNYSETYSYDAIGNITAKNGVTYTYAGTDYANPHAVTSVGATNYTYDNNGNLLTDGTLTNTWDYDNRLSQSVVGATTVNYSYDAGGQRIKYSSSQGSSESVELLDAPWHLAGNDGSAELYQSVPQDILNGKESITVTYNLHGICAIGGDASAIIFDQNGWKFIALADYGQNCFDGEQTVTIPLTDFPGLNTNANLTGMFHTRFWYGSAFTVDILSAKLNGPGSGSTTTTVYPSKYYNTDGTTPTKHIFAGDQLIGTIKGTGVGVVVYSVATDHLTGSNVVTNSSGAIEEVMDYYPYGGVRLDEKAGSFSEQRKFAGHELDVDTGLSYMNARYYNSGMGRFISQDPLAMKNPEKILEDPQSLNSYAYARNNPLVNIDPTGNISINVFGLFSNSTQMRVGNWANRAYQNNSVARVAMNNPWAPGVIGTAPLVAYGAAAAAPTIAVWALANPQLVVNSSVGAVSGVMAKAISNAETGEKSSLLTYGLNAIGGGLSYKAGQSDNPIRNTAGLSFGVSVFSDYIDGRTIDWSGATLSGSVSGGTTAVTNQVPGVRGPIAQNYPSAITSARTQQQLKLESFSFSMGVWADTIKNTGSTIFNSLQRAWNGKEDK